MTRHLQSKWKLIEFFIFCHMPGKCGPWCTMKMLRTHTHTQTIPIHWSIVDRALQQIKPSHTMVLILPSISTNVLLLRRLLSNSVSNTSWKATSTMKTPARRIVFISLLFSKLLWSFLSMMIRSSVEILLRYKNAKRALICPFSAWTHGQNSRNTFSLSSLTTLYRLLKG